MPLARLERTRESYRCHRSLVIVPWQHCDCKNCSFARLMHTRMRAGLTSGGYASYAEMLADEGFGSWFMVADVDGPKP